MASCRFVFSPEYFCDVGAHVFPMRKFALVRQALLASGRVYEADFLLPEPAPREDLALVHTDPYLDDFFGLRWTPRTSRSELPLTTEVVRAYTRAVGGTELAALAALESGFAMNLSGGFHHAFPDHAEGFCYLNDVAVAIRLLRSRRLIDRAMVVDLDVHQGNGTAFIFHAEPNVFTFSMHQESNYPVKQPGSLDLGLPDKTGDAEYLRVLVERLPPLLDSHRPELVVYVAGADPYEHDLLGGLALTRDGLRRRDAEVLHACARRRIPVAVVLGGGYAQALQDTVDLHAATGLLLWEISRTPQADAASRPGKDG